jgi:hypothetical protein
MYKSALEVRTINALIITMRISGIRANMIPEVEDEYESRECSRPARRFKRYPDLPHCGGLQ